MSIAESIAAQLMQGPAAVHTGWFNDAEDRRIEVERERYLSNPDTINKLVANITKQNVPEKARAKLGSGANLQKVEKNIPDDDPRKKIGSMVADEAPGVIEMNPGMHPYTVISELYKKRYTEELPNVYKYIDSARKGWLPFGLSDKKVGVGGDIPSAPGYEEYRANKDAENKTHFNTEEMSNPIAAGLAGAIPAAAHTVLEPLAKAGRGGLVVKALTGMSKLLGGAAFKSVSNPLLKIGLTAAAAIPEWWALEGAEQLATKNSVMQDAGPVTKAVVGAGAGIAAAMTVGGVTKKLAGLIPGVNAAKEAVSSATEAAAASPTSTALMTLKDAQGGMEREFGKVAKVATPDNDKIYARRIITSMDDLNSMGFGPMEAGASSMDAAAKEKEIMPKMLRGLQDEAPDVAGKQADTSTFYKALNAGNSPEEAIMAARRGRGLRYFDDIVKAANGETFKHPSNVVTSLEELGIGKTEAPNIHPRVAEDLIVKGAKESPAQKEGELIAGEIAKKSTNVFNTSEVSKFVGSAKTNRLATMKAELGEAVDKEKPFTLGEEAEMEARKEAIISGKQIQKAMEEPKFMLDRQHMDDSVERSIGDALYSPGKLFEAVSDEDFQKAMQTVSSHTEGMAAAPRAYDDAYYKAAGSLFDDFEAGKIGAEEYSNKLDSLMTEGAAETAKKVRGKKVKAAVETPAAEVEAGVKPEINAGQGWDMTDPTKVANQAYKDMMSGKITEEVYDSLMDKVMNGLGKSVPKMAFLIAGAGGIIGMGSLMTPSEADAAPLGMAAGATTNWAKDMLGSVEKIVKAKLFTPAYEAGTKDFGEKGRSISIFPDINSVTRKGKMWLQGILSPNVVGEVLYDARDAAGKKLPTNPMMELGHRISIAQANAKKGMELIADIMKDVEGGESHAKEIADAMKPLLSKHEELLEASFHKGNIEALDKEIANITKKAEKLTGVEKDTYLESASKLRDMQDASKQELERLGKVAEDFQVQWESIVRPLAEKFPSTRIALASEGIGMEAADPWVLKYMTDSEKEAVGHLTNFHEKVGGYIREVGGDTINSKPYIHHAAHPDMDYKSLIGKLEDYTFDKKAVLPLSKLYSRSFGSLQMMPDLQYIEQKYMPDVFRRIEMMDFWKRGKPNGWAAHMQKVNEMGLRGPADFMKSIEKAFMPEDMSTLNDIARQAYALEAARLIGMNPSPSFKHLMKMMVNWTNFGVANTARAIPDAFNLWRKDMAATAMEKMGMKVTRDVETEMYHTFTHAGNMSAMIQDLSLYDEPKGWFGKITDSLNKKAGALINTAERFDRAVSFVGAMNMAAKKGMTAEQATYALYDTILKTNFMSGIQNPEWLKNPKVRAMLMFQGTPFKILEQRMLLASRGGRAFSDAAKETWEQLQNLRGLIKEGENEFKLGMIKDALTKEKDIYGIPYSYQLMRQMLGVGTVILGGSKLFDSDMTGHMLHVPFLKFEGGKASMQFNPVVNAAIEVTTGHKGKDSEDDFWLSSFWKKWAGSNPMPSAITKSLRLSNDDIPDVYRGSKFRYLFGVPATKEE